MLDFRTVYGARIRKDTSVYYFADSSEHGEMMCCIFKGKMYSYYYKEICDSNQKLYEAFVEALALLNIHNKRHRFKHMIKSSMHREEIKDIKVIINQLSEDFIADVVIDLECK